MDSGGSLRETFLALIVGTPSMGIVVSLWFGWSLHTYLSTSPRIEAWQDLERFKRIVSTQMYGALALIGFLIIPGPLFVIGLLTKEIRWPVDIVFLIVPLTVLYGVGTILRRIESRAKSLPVAEEFRGEYQRVVETWMKKPLPDW